jgi:hypothetical protein
MEAEVTTNLEEKGRLWLNVRNSSLGDKFMFDYNGDFHADGDVIAYSSTVSDKRFKHNVVKIENSLDLVSQLRGVSFDWDERIGRGHDIGLIAQEVEAIIPEVVSDKSYVFNGEETEIKVVAYDRLVSVLINAVNELKDEVDELKKRL